MGRGSRGSGASGGSGRGAQPAGRAQPTAAAMASGRAFSDADEPTFAQRALEARDEVPASERVFGDAVFISDALERAQSREPGLSASEFKRRLVEAQKSGLISLTRADLVERIDQAKVRASEIERMGATFHFIGPPRKKKR